MAVDGGRGGVFGNNGFLKRFLPPSHPSIIAES